MTDNINQTYPLFSADHPKYKDRAEVPEGTTTLQKPELAVTKASAEDVLGQGWAADLSTAFKFNNGARQGSASSADHAFKDLLVRRALRQDSEATLVDFSRRQSRSNSGKIRLEVVPNEPSTNPEDDSSKSEGHEDEAAFGKYQFRPGITPIQAPENGRQARLDSDATLVDTGSWNRWGSRSDRRRSSSTLQVRSRTRSRQASSFGLWAPTLPDLDDSSFEKEDLGIETMERQILEPSPLISLDPWATVDRGLLKGGLRPPIIPDDDDEKAESILATADAQVLPPENAVIAAGLPPSVQHDEPIMSTPAPFVQEKLPVLNIPKDLRVVKNFYTVRPLWFQRTWQSSIHTLQLSLIYFFLIGFPLWDGAVYSFWIAYHGLLKVKAGAAIFIGIACFYSIIQLTCQFEKQPEATEEWMAENRKKATEMAVLIPCYKSANIVGGTIEACLKTFPARNIFVIANGNSPTPLDHTEEVCNRYGVRHIWVPIGSKITAQFFGCQYAREFKYCLLIDDDVHIPDVFPLVTERIKLGKGIGGTKCIGYCIKSTGPDGIPGSMCQQAQDIEYKLSGLARTFCGRWGSATFPHGAVAIWEREFLEECFRRHPGFTISEDWFFGYVCRQLGGRIEMCSQAFVETETPINLYRKGEAGRAGYGEMTVTSQRFSRWNFFLVSRTYHNLIYVLFSWRMGLSELSCKLWVMQEMYTTLMMISMPLILPVTLAAAPGFTIGLMCATEVMYYLIVIFFNEFHLRRRGQSINRKVVMLYYIPYKLFLRGVNVLSCYVAIYKYARYYRQHHPKILGNEKVVNYMNVLASQSHTQYSDGENPLEEPAPVNPDSPAAENEQISDLEAGLAQPSPSGNVLQADTETSPRSSLSNPFNEKQDQLSAEVGSITNLEIAPAQAGPAGDMLQEQAEPSPRSSLSNPFNEKQDEPSAEVGNTTNLEIDPAQAGPAGDMLQEQTEPSPRSSISSLFNEKRDGPFSQVGNTTGLRPALTQARSAGNMAQGEAMATPLSTFSNPFDVTRGEPSSPRSSIGDPFSDRQQASLRQPSINGTSIHRMASDWSVNSNAETALSNPFGSRHELETEARLDTGARLDTQAQLEENQDQEMLYSAPSKSFRGRLASGLRQFFGGSRSSRRDEQVLADSASHSSRGSSRFLDDM